MGRKKALISTASFVNLLLIWTHFQQIGKTDFGPLLIYCLRKLVRVVSDAGGWSRGSSLCLCFASAAHVQSLDLHHTGPRSSEGGLCLLNKHLSQGDQKFWLLCVCFVCINALVCVCMVGTNISHQPSLISYQLLTERSQVLVFPVFFKTAFHPQFVQRALYSQFGHDT